MCARARASGNIPQLVLSATAMSIFGSLIAKAILCVISKESAEKRQKLDHLASMKYLKSISGFTRLIISGNDKKVPCLCSCVRAFVRAHSQVTWLMGVK